MNPACRQPLLAISNTISSACCSADGGHRAKLAGTPPFCRLPKNALLLRVTMENLHPAIPSKVVRDNLSCTRSFEILHPSFSETSQPFYDCILIYYDGHHLSCSSTDLAAASPVFSYLLNHAIGPALPHPPTSDLQPVWRIRLPEDSSHVFELVNLLHNPQCRFFRLLQSKLAPLTAKDALYLRRLLYMTSQYGMTGAAFACKFISSVKENTLLHSYCRSGRDFCLSGET